jgi:hypothetical protein
MFGYVALDVVASLGRGRLPDLQSLGRAQAVAHILKPKRLGVVIERGAGLLALMDVENGRVGGAVLALTDSQTCHKTGGHTKNLDEILDVASVFDSFVV